MKARTRNPRHPYAFSLVEVVLALGVISFALVAIIGLLPIGLASGRSSIEESRANHLADEIFATLRSQPFASVDLTPFANTSDPPVDLSVANTASGGVGIVVHATYDGSFVPDPDYFTIELRFRNTPEGIVSGTASEVRVQISGRDAGATRMDYVSIVAAH